MRRTSNALWEELTITRTARGCERLDTRYRLVRQLGRLEIENRLWKTRTYDKESAFFPFPFAQSGSPLEYEVNGGVAGAHHPAVPDGAEHMRAIRRWISVPSVGAWVSVDAPLVQVGGLYLPYRPFPSSIPDDATSHELIASWVMNNIWDTNFPASQAGETGFRYTISPAGTRGGALRTAIEATTPLVGVVLSGRGSVGAEPTSLFSCASTEIELLHLTRDGSDLVAVLHSHADVPLRAAVGSSPIDIARGALARVRLSG